MPNLTRPFAALRDWFADRWPCAEDHVREPLDWTWAELSGQTAPNWGQDPLPNQPAGSPPKGAKKGPT